MLPLGPFEFSDTTKRSPNSVRVKPTDHRENHDLLYVLVDGYGRGQEDDHNWKADAERDLDFCE